MAVKTFNDIQRDLKNKIYAPVYLFQGEEAYFIDHLSANIEANVLDEMGKEFNQTVVYGRETEVTQLLSMAKRYPMMSNYQVVIVREAQDMKCFTGRRSEAEVDMLVGYLNNPLNSTVLVFDIKYKELDKRSKLYKAFEKNAVVFNSEKLYDNKIPDWVTNYLAEKGVKIKPAATQLIADYLGNDLSRVVNECDKLLLNIKKGEEIDVQHIEENIGISKEYNVFELNTAPSAKQKLKAYRIASYFKANPKNNPLVITLGSLYTFYSKVLLFHSLPDKSRNTAAGALGVNPYFIKEYENAAKNYPPSKTAAVIGLLHEYDLKSKGINNQSVSEGDLLRELVYKILH